MSPNAHSVLSALKWMSQLPAITTIATGHGSRLNHNVTELTSHYRQWSEEAGVDLGQWLSRDRTIKQSPG